MSNLKAEIQENRKQVWETFKTHMRGIQSTDSVRREYIVAITVTVTPDRSLHPSVLTVSIDIAGRDRTTVTAKTGYCVRGAVKHKELMTLLVDELGFEGIGSFKYLL